MVELHQQYKLDIDKHIRRKRNYMWQTALLLLLSFELVVALVLHRDNEELQTQLIEGEPMEQVEALFMLTNRGEPEPLTSETLDRFAESGDRLLREWLMTSNFSRFTTPEFEKKLIESARDPVEAERFQFYDTHRIGKRCDVTLEELASLLDS